MDSERDPQLAEPTGIVPADGAIVDDEATAATWIRATPAPIAPNTVRADNPAVSLPRVVVENLDGEDLATHVAGRGPLNPEEVALLAQPLCEALLRMRSHGVTFRVLSPSQVFLSGGLLAFAPKLVGAGNT